MIVLNVTFILQFFCMPNQVKDPDLNNVILYERWRSAKKGINVSSFYVLGVANQMFMQHPSLCAVVYANVRPSLS